MNFIIAFLVGGGICLLCQLILEFTKILPVYLLVTLVVLGALLCAFGLFEPLVEFAGCGVTVPLLGFGNLVAKGAIAAVREMGLIGAFTGGFTASSGGITVCIVVASLAAIFAKSKDQN